jgi:hypothetical protein
MKPMYVNENGGRYPDRFQELLPTQDLAAEVLFCSSSQGERALGATRQEQAATSPPATTRRA